MTARTRRGGGAGPWIVTTGSLAVLAVLLGYGGNDTAAQRDAITVTAQARDADARALADAYLTICQQDSKVAQPVWCTRSEQVRDAAPVAAVQPAQPVLTPVTDDRLRQAIADYLTRNPPATTDGQKQDTTALEQAVYARLRAELPAPVPGQDGQNGQDGADAAPVDYPRIIAAVLDQLTPTEQAVAEYCAGQPGGSCRGQDGADGRSVVQFSGPARMADTGACTLTVVYSSGPAQPLSVPDVLCAPPPSSSEDPPLPLPTG